MPWSSVSGRWESPKIDLVIDMGNPFLNRTVDGFLKIAVVGASKVAAEETYHCVQKAATVNLLAAAATVITIVAAAAVTVVAAGCSPQPESKSQLAAGREENSPLPSLLAVAAPCPSHSLPSPISPSQQKEENLTNPNLGKLHFWHWLFHELHHSPSFFISTQISPTSVYIV